MLFKKSHKDLVQIEYLKMRLSKDVEDLVKMTFNSISLKMRHIPWKTLDDMLQITLIQSFSRLLKDGSVF